MAIDERERRREELETLSDAELRRRAESAGVEHGWRPRRAVIRDLAATDGDAGGESARDGGGDARGGPVAGDAAPASAAEPAPAQPEPAPGAEPDPAPPPAPAPPARAGDGAEPVPGRPGAARRLVVRLPDTTPLAPFAGWLAAWGAAALAAAILVAAGIDLGLGLGVADADGAASGLNPAFLSPDLAPGLWMLGIQAGAFLAGGYFAARMARHRGIAHAVAAWLVAMAATAADAIATAVRGEPQVLGPLGIPSWVDNGLSGGVGTVFALAAIAAAGLVGAIAGGALGQGANRAARMEVDEAAVR